MSFLQHRFALLKSVLLYLDCKKQFEDIRENAVKYRHLKESFIYDFSVDVDLRFIFEQDAVLGTNILSLPLESANLFQEVIFQFCLSHDLLPPNTTPSQMCIRLRITNFPSNCDSLQISKMSDLMKYLNHQGFVRLVGIAAGVSGLAKYTQSTKYICPSEGCSGRDGNHYIRIHVPGASETETIRNNFTCTLCGETLEEVKSMRILSDKIAMEVIPIHLQSLGGKEVFKATYSEAILVFVRDELVNVVEPGKAYEIIGICRTDFLGDNISVKFETNNISQLSKSLPIHMTSLPVFFQDQYNRCRESPWCFPLNLAYKFGDMIVSGGTMIKLRLLLLISLVLCPQKNSLHILAIGRETRLIHSLMEYAQQFSLRTFQASATVPLTGKVIFDKHAWAPYFIQCGSLLLSRGGVCFVGDLGNWKKTRKDQLQATLTCNKVIFDFATKVSAGLSQQLSFALECQVWSLYDPRIKSVKTSSCQDQILGGCDTGDLTKSFIDAFSYACFLDAGDSTTQKEILTQMTCHILSSWCEQENDTAQSVSKEDFEHISSSLCAMLMSVLSNGLPSQTITRITAQVCALVSAHQYGQVIQFLAVSRQVEVRMSPEAESLIQSYYTASRTARSSGLCGSDVPPSALFTLTSLSVGFAKLKLQPVVSKCDALIAIFLYEESLAARFGASMLNIHPQPHVPNSSIDDFLGIQNDIMMQTFHVKLLRFCSCFMDNYSIHREE